MSGVKEANSIGSALLVKVAWIRPNHCTKLEAGVVCSVYPQSLPADLSPFSKLRSGNIGKLKLTQKD